MACDASFSNTLVRGRCSGWLSLRKASSQQVMMVLSKPAPHITWRLFSDFTRDWIWSTTAHWISCESWNGHRVEVSGMQLKPHHDWFFIFGCKNLAPRKEASKVRGSSATARLLCKALTWTVCIYPSSSSATYIWAFLPQPPGSEGKEQSAVIQKGPPSRSDY